MTLRRPTGREWRKSSRSDNQSACVEILDLDRHIAVRDSKDPDGPVIIASASAWQAFVAYCSANT